MLAAHAMIRATDAWLEPAERLVEFRKRRELALKQKDLEYDQLRLLDDVISALQELSELRSEQAAALAAQLAAERRSQAQQLISATSARDERDERIASLTRELGAARQQHATEIAALQAA